MEIIKSIPLKLFVFIYILNCLSTFFDFYDCMQTGADEIPLSNSQPMASQEPNDEETSPTHATPVVPAQPDVPSPTIASQEPIAPTHAPAHALGIKIRRPFVPFMRRESDRIKQIVFKRPPPLVQD